MKLRGGGGVENHQDFKLILDGICTILNEVTVTSGCVALACHAIFRVASGKHDIGSPAIKTRTPMMKVP